MKTACVLSMLLLGVSVAAVAQDRATHKSDLPPVQSPPSLNDPGVVPAQAEQSTTTVKAKQGNAPSGTAAAQSPGLPAEVQAAAEASELPVVTVRQSGSDTVEEYRKHGKVVFVRVLSKDGPPKYYVDNPGNIPPNLMKQLSGPSGVVQPVYYKLFEWK